jgi:hypothetical protein
VAVTGTPIDRGLAPVGLADDLDRILAVLALDTPAIRTIAAAHLIGRHGTAWQTAGIIR